ncbi:MAG: hypothetical protein ACM3P1_04215 [Candidatus Saccharibacteria bacterium]
MKSLKMLLNSGVVAFGASVFLTSFITLIKIIIKWDAHSARQFIQMYLDAVSQPLHSSALFHFLFCLCFLIFFILNLVMVSKGKRLY